MPEAGLRVPLSLCDGGGLMPELSDPITVNTTVKSVRFDEDGECLLTLRVPASDAVRAARLAVMRGIVFSTVMTPADVRNTEPTV